MTAAQELLDTVPPESTIADELGRAYGEAVAGSTSSPRAVTISPSPRSSIGSRTRRLACSADTRRCRASSPTEVDGARGADDRSGDIRFGLQLSCRDRGHGPERDPEQQALAILPFSVQDLTGFDEIADLLAAGQLEALEGRIDEALSDAEPSWSARWPTPSASGSSSSTTSITARFFSGYDAGGG